MALQNFRDRVGPAVSASWLNALDIMQQNGSDTGAVNAYVAGYGTQTFTLTLFAGMLIKFSAANVNTGASTINVAGTGVKSIVNELGNALTGGEIQTLVPTWLQYTGTVWQLAGNGVTPDKARTAAEIAAAITSINYNFLPGDLRRMGCTLNGVTDDTTAFARAVSICDRQPILPWDGTVLLDQVTSFTPPAGGKISGTVKSVINRPAGNADIFTVSNADCTFEGFRMTGPNNTACDGIISDNTVRTTVLFVQGYQLSTTFTAGNANQCTDQIAIGVFSDSNTQQGVLFNRVDRGVILSCISQLIGTSELHHGFYIGHCTRVLVGFNIARACAGSGINVFSQDAFAARRIIVAHNECSGNGTSGAGNRAGILIARANDGSSLRQVLIHGNGCQNNSGFNIYAENCDDCDIQDNEVDGNALGITNGIIVTSTHNGITSRVNVKNNRILAHGSGLRISASAATTLEMEVDGNTLEQNTTGIFQDGAGTVQIRLGRDNRFRANTTDLTGTFTYETISGNVSTMTGGENFRFRDGPVFVKDPGGANRIFNPAGVFPAGYTVTLINTADAAETITFDSGVLAQAVAQDEAGIFVYNGATWRTVWVGINRTVTSGVYTPALAAVANVSATTAYECQWLRIGNTITVSGKLDADPTAGGVQTQVGIALPVASNIGAQEDCAGTAFCPTIAAEGAAILGDAANNRALMEWISADITNQPRYFTFTYQVI